MEIGVSGMVGFYKVPASCCVSPDDPICEGARKLALAGALPNTIHTEVSSLVIF